MSFRDVCYSRRQNDCVHDQPGQTLEDYLPISLPNKQNQLVTELPSLPINREISRKYSKINPISRFLFATSRKRIVLSFCTRIFRVSHLQYTESAESSRAETIEVYPTAGSVTCWPSRSMQAAAATV